jgi:hypothetical protein
MSRSPPKLAGHAEISTGVIDATALFAAAILSSLIERRELSPRRQLRDRQPPAQARTARLQALPRLADPDAERVASLRETSHRL